jgi:hypothetical protein
MNVETDAVVITKKAPIVTNISVFNKDQCRHKVYPKVKGILYIAFPVDLFPSEYVQ